MIEKNDWKNVKSKKNKVVKLGFSAGRAYFIRSRKLGSNPSLNIIYI